MNSLETAIAHMLWSDQKFFDLVLQLPEESLALTAAPGEWTVGHLMMHFVESAEWFHFCLTRTPWSEHLPAQTMADVRRFKAHLADLAPAFTLQVGLEDELLSIDTGEETITAQRSMILSQAVVHTAEHKGQIASILRSNGVVFDLDRLDVWHFSRKH
jgi:uncharacterized damage-inducible protein DinB